MNEDLERTKAANRAWLEFAKQPHIDKSYRNDDTNKNMTNVLESEVNHGTDNQAGRLLHGLC